MCHLGDKPTRTGTCVEAIVMGSAQDAGVPQLGCACSNCTAARQNRRIARTPSSVAIRGPDGVLLLDASPAVIAQLDELGEFTWLGIALTHGHAGHIAGLSVLGKEGPQMAGTLWATPKMHEHIDATSILCDGVAHMRRCAVAPGESAGPYNLQFHHINHRAERTDTVAIEVQGHAHRLLYLPDTDTWDGAVSAAVERLDKGDVLLFDATFWSAAEVGHRAVGEIPHPFVQETLPQLEALAERGVRVYLTHLNHTNPLCDSGSDAWELVRASGVHVASDGDRIAL